MSNSTFNIIVNYLSKHQKKIITNEVIKTKLQNILDQDYSDSKMYKMIYYLKLRGHLINLKKNVFFVKKSEENYTEDQLSDLLYRTILKKHSKEFIQGRWYI